MLALDWKRARLINLVDGPAAKGYQNISKIDMLRNYTSSMYRPDLTPGGRVVIGWVMIGAYILIKRKTFNVTICSYLICHYDDVIMGAMASQITSLTIVYSTVYSGADQSPASLAFVWGIRRGPVNSPHKKPVTRKMLPFDDVIVSKWRLGLNDYIIITLCVCWRSYTVYIQPLVIWQFSPSPSISLTWISW